MARAPPRPAGIACAAARRPDWAEETRPGRPLRIGRRLAEQSRGRLGRPFLIDNRPRAGGSIGIRAVIQSPPDGSAFLPTGASLASMPALDPGQGLDPRTAPTRVSLMAEIPTPMVVRTDGPWHSVQDVVAAPDPPATSRARSSSRWRAAGSSMSPAELRRRR